MSKRMKNLLFIIGIITFSVVSILWPAVNATEAILACGLLAYAIYNESEPEKKVEKKGETEQE